MKPFRRWVGLLLVCLSSPLFAEVVFPGAEWESRTPEEVGLAAEPLQKLGQELGGRGCIIKDGYIVHSWGDLTQRGDWFSSAKPVLSTLLFFALQEGRVKSVDQPIMEFGWDFREKDRGITFRHLGAMTSGYARPEPAGEAYAYNDFAIQLYQKTLFDRVFQENPKAAAEHPARLGALGMKEGLSFRESNRRISASVEDFARIVWLWANRGKWGDRQLIPESTFEEYCRPQVPKDLPHTQPAETDDYLGIGSYGGGSDHFTEGGPGIYGFNWWFNQTGRQHPEQRTWPDAPDDAFMSIGARGNSSLILPSSRLVLVCAEGDWGKLEPGRKESKTNRHVRRLQEALGAANSPE